MSVQRLRMREILETLNLHGVFTVVGGPWVTVQEDYFEDVTDVIFVGEAEETWPQFLNEWQQGLQQYRYDQLEKSDMTKVPVPRFVRKTTLLGARHYLEICRQSDDMADESVMPRLGCPARSELRTVSWICAELNSFPLSESKLGGDHWKNFADWNILFVASDRVKSFVPTAMI
jgi:hypothetical protein